MTDELNEDLKQALDEVAYQVWLDYEADFGKEVDHDVSDYLYFAVLEGAKFYKAMGHTFEWDKEVEEVEE